MSAATFLPIIKLPKIDFKLTYWDNALIVRLLLSKYYNLKNVACVLWPFILVKLLHHRCLMFITSELQLVAYYVWLSWSTATISSEDVVHYLLNDAIQCDKTLGINRDMINYNEFSDIFHRVKVWTVPTPAPFVLFLK